jgi:hypothetical protein
MSQAKGKKEIKGFTWDLEIIKKKKKDKALKQDPFTYTSPHKKKSLFFFPFESNLLLGQFYYPNIFI